MSADNIGVAASLDKYGEEDLFSLLVRYGLFFGAIFQFVCISAAVVMSSNETVDSIDESCLIDEPAPGSANAARRLHKIRKLEKKKRR